MKGFWTRWNEAFGATQIPFPLALDELPKRLLRVGQKLGWKRDPAISEAGPQTGKTAWVTGQAHRAARMCEF